MSVTGLANKNILNIANQNGALDLNTRNPYFSTILGYEAGTLCVGLYNTIVGYRAGYKTKKAQRNTYIGANAGKNNTEDDNLLIGFDTGQGLITGKENVMLGNFVGNNLNADNNIFIGFQHTSFSSNDLASSNNVGIGHMATTLGYFVNSIGNNNDIDSFKTNAYGNTLYDRSSNSILIGEGINNYGNFSTIINTIRPSNNRIANSNEKYMNIQDIITSDITSSGAYLFTLCNDNIDIKSTGTSIKMNASNIDITASNSQMNLSDYVHINGLYGHFNIDQNDIDIRNTTKSTGLFIDDVAILHGTHSGLVLGSNIVSMSNSSNSLLSMDSSIDMRSTHSQLLLSSNASLITNSSNSSLNLDKSVQLIGTFSKLTLGSNYTFLNNSSNSSLEMDSSISLLGTYSTLVLGSNHVSLSNSSNGFLNIDKSVVLNGTFGSLVMTSNLSSLCNSSNSLLTMDESIMLKGTFTEMILGSNYAVLRQSSNSSASFDDCIEFKGRYSSTLLGSNLVTLCNSSNSAIKMDESILIKGTHTTISLSSNMFGISQTSNSETVVDNCFRFHGRYSQLITGSNISFFNNGCNVSMLLENDTMSNTAAQIVNNAEVKCNSNINILGRIKMCYSNFADPHWEVFLSNPGTAVSSDMIFKSKNGTSIAWTDDFFPELLNFTGKHRCTSTDIDTGEANDLSSFLGKIVVATGQYKNLDDEYKIAIDEAIPMVRLSSEEYDMRAFGVISGFEERDKPRSFRFGNLQFTKERISKDYKVIINSVGEGGVWITNANGNLKNGDLITTSSIPGYGMKQKGKNIMSYTVGKITCDCSFNLESTLYKCEEFAAHGQVYKRAFVGCTYKF